MFRNIRQVQQNFLETDGLSFKEYVADIPPTPPPLPQTAMSMSVSRQIAKIATHTSEKLQYYAAVSRTPTNTSVGICAFKAATAPVYLNEQIPATTPELCMALPKAWFNAVCLTNGNMTFTHNVKTWNAYQKLQSDRGHLGGVAWGHFDCQFPDSLYEKMMKNHKIVVVCVDSPTVNEPRTMLYTLDRTAYISRESRTFTLKLDFGAKLFQIPGGTELVWKWHVGNYRYGEVTRAIDPYSAAGKAINKLQWSDSNNTGVPVCIFVVGDDAEPLYTYRGIRSPLHDILNKITTQFEDLTTNVNAIAHTAQGAKNLTEEEWDEMKEQIDDNFKKLAERIDNVDGGGSGSSFWGDLIGAGAGVLGSAISTGIETQGALKRAVAETAASKVDAIADGVSGLGSGLKGALETANAARVAMNAIVTSMKQQVHGMVSTVHDITTTIHTIDTWGDSKGNAKKFPDRMEDNTENIYELQDNVQTTSLELGTLKQKVDAHWALMDTAEKPDEDEIPINQAMVSQHEKQIEQLITVIAEIHNSVRDLKNAGLQPSMNVLYTTGNLYHR